jgi:rod shape determining protein RodA
MTFLAGARFRNLVLIVLVGVVVLVGAWVTPGVGLKEYQKERVRCFVDPERNPDSPAAYNARQAMQAIMSGGREGRGWGQGILNLLRRVPERHTDFIFPVVAEEWGFVRTAPLVCLYLAIATMLTILAASEKDPFGRLIVGGVMTLFTFQSLVHMAISLGLAPITGLTLPLVSYGGSSLVSTFAGLGLVASVRMHPNEDLFTAA